MSFSTTSERSGFSPVCLQSFHATIPSFNFFTCSGFALPEGCCRTKFAVVGRVSSPNLRNRCPSNTSNRMNVKVLFSCAVIVILSGCFSGYRSEADSKSLRVRRGTFASDVIITGELRAAHGDELAVPRLPQWQTSIKWLAPDGAAMKKGDRIVELDTSTFSTNLDAKRQAVAQAEQQLQQKEAEWKADTLDKQLDVERKRADYDKTKLDAAVPRELISQREYNDRQIKFK